ncbi:replication initiator protein A [Marinilactibacillus psychrotolerans]|uniref:Replication initiator protein A n=1 Tax=Marinilactibacillus psychrotolerans TaxID=191770 RepID=A0ABW8UG85_9LACT
MSGNKKHNIMERAKYTYFQLPKLLMYGEKYQKKIKAVDKLAYAVLLDRLNISVENGWVDDNGDIYFVYRNESLMDVLNVSKATVVAIKKRLTEAGLLLEETTGRANRLYLLEPVPASKDEAKYIIQKDKEDMEDESKMTEEEKRKISESMKKRKGYKEGEEQDEVQKLNSDFETPENQGSSEPENKTKSKNYTSEVKKLNPSNNNLSSNKDNKDFKDNKESYADQNTKLKNSIHAYKGDYDVEKQLIDHFIEEHDIIGNYGEWLVSNFKKFSRGEFETFRVFYEKLYYAHQSAEKESGIHFALDSYFTNRSDAFKLELSKTFWKIIQLDRQGKIKKDVNNLLFSSFKNDFLSFAENIKYEQEHRDEPGVPTTDFLQENEG